MKRMMQLSATLVMAVAVSACAGDDARPMDETPGATGTGGAVTGTTGTMEADREFVEEQLALGNTEIELGRMAQERGTHPDVKEFGAMMVREHQAAAEELRPIGSQLGTAAGALGTEAREEAREELTELREELAQLTGRDFDRKYIEEMIDDHEAGIRDLESRVENAANADVRTWASRTLPKMRQHLERAKSIKDALDNAGDS